MLQFGDMEPFPTSVDVGASTRFQLLTILQNTQMCSLLRVELAIVIDAGHPFVTATYQLEGDGPLIFNVYEEIATVRAAIHSAHYPNLVAVIQQISQGDLILQNQLKTYALNCIQPGLQYFSEQLESDSSLPLSAFKAARLFSPNKVNEMKPVAADVDILLALPFLSDSATIANLKMELPAYLAKVIDISPQVDALDWWEQNEPRFTALVGSSKKKTLLVQPSSAAAERAFSLLVNSFNDRRQNSLEDYMEASIMLQYNNH